MEERATRSLRTTLLTGLTLIALCVVVGFASLVYARAHRIAHESMENRLELQAETLAGLLEVTPEGFEFESPEMIRDFLQPGSGAYAVICDPQGVPVVRSPSIGDNSLPAPGSWEDGGFRIRDLEADEAPDGIPCALISYPFMVRFDPGDEEDRPEGWSPPTEEERRFQVQVAMDSRDRDRGLSGLALFLLLTGGAALVVTIGAGLFLARRVLRPVRRMTAEAELLTPEDTSRRLGPKTVVKELNSLATKLNSAFDRLGAALDRQRQFTSDASHELRTPITVILGNSELLLRRERAPADYRKGLERQHRTALKMRQIIESLLTLARTDASGESLQREQIPAEDLLGGLCDEFQVLAREKGIRIDCDIDEGVQIVGDRQYLDQLVTNLVSNALKFTPKGGTIDLRAVGENGHAIFTISDSGQGIPEDRLPHIFDRFYRVSQGRDRNEGAGLGLSIVDWIVKAHEGEITVESEEGHGTTFTVRLPGKTRREDPVLVHVP